MIVFCGALRDLGWQHIAIVNDGATDGVHVYQDTSNTEELVIDTIGKISPSGAEGNGDGG